MANSATHDLHRLLYTSESRIVGTHEQVSERIAGIVEVSVGKNAARDVSGILLFTNGIFIQVLEGSAAGLEETFETICSDMRHGNLRLIEMARAEQRLFSHWSMAFLSSDESQGQITIQRDLTEISFTVDSNPAQALRQMQGLLAA